MTIHVPRVLWSLGDAEINAAGCAMRPLFFKGHRVGEIQRDVADILIQALTSANEKNGGE